MYVNTFLTFFLNSNIITKIAMPVLLFLVHGFSRKYTLFKDEI